MRYSEGLSMTSLGDNDGSHIFHIIEKPARKDAQDATFVLFAAVLES